MSNQKNVLYTQTYYSSIVKTVIASVGYQGPPGPAGSNNLNNTTAVTGLGSNTILSVNNLGNLLTSLTLTQLSNLLKPLLAKPALKFSNHKNSQYLVSRW